MPFLDRALGVLDMGEAGRRAAARVRARRSSRFSSVTSWCRVEKASRRGSGMCACCLSPEQQVQCHHAGGHFRLPWDVQGHDAASCKLHTAFQVSRHYISWLIHVLQQEAEGSWPAAAAADWAAAGADRASPQAGQQLWDASAAAAGAAAPDDCSIGYPSDRVRLAACCAAPAAGC
jgi:hypothetical protein